MTNPQAVALGESAADLVVMGGDVFLAERGVFERRDVVIAGDRIANLPPDGSDAAGSDTRVVDASGRSVVPGFVDAHTHADSPQTVETTYHRSLAGGTTAVITEMSELCSGVGPDALAAYLNATDGLPLTVFPTVPPQWFYTLFEPSVATDRERERLLDSLAHERVVAVGELDWIFITGRESPVLALAHRAHREDKRVVGHGAGCHDDRYAAFASVIDNDHEAIEPAEVRERLDNGVHVVGRSGTGRDDIPAIAAVATEIPPTELSLATDGLDLRDLLSRGHMDAVIRHTIQAGVDPIDAIRMATLAPARHFRLGRRGTLAPGSVADVVVLDDVERVEVHTVIAGGEVVVESGDPMVGPRQYRYPDTMREAVDLSIEADAFVVAATAARGGAVRAMGYTNGFFTVDETARPRRSDGKLWAAPDRDLLKAALLCRHPRRDARFTGFLTGFGLQAGAVATSVTWEVPGLTVVGATDEAMVRAARRVAALGGGWVVVDADGVVAEVALPIGGVATDVPVTDTANAFETVERAMHDRGVESERALIGVETLTFPGVPELKLTFSGYANIVERKVVGLTPDP